MTDNFAGEAGDLPDWRLMGREKRRSVAWRVQTSLLLSPLSGRVTEAFGVKTVIFIRFFCFGLFFKTHPIFLPLSFLKERARVSSVV